MMQFNLRHAACGLLFAGVLTAAGSAAADPADVHARVRVGPHGNVGVRTTVRPVDRLRRVPPEIRLHGFRGGNVHVRVGTFRPFVGARITRFSPRERAIWVRGRWWHGRHLGRFGWWWFADGSWFFYPAPIYPYPDYVSQTYYEAPAEDYGNYWYYCRDPEGYYPYVQHCNRAWEPVPTQPEGSAYGGGGYGGQDQYENGGPDQYDNGGPDQDEMGSDEGGPPDEEGPPGEGPPDEGPPDDNGPPPRE